MGNEGIVYALVNPSLPGMLKIGRTNRDVEQRAKELSSSTGVPTPFIVIFQESFSDCVNAEIFIHTYLEENGYRVSTNREFFQIEPNIAIRAIMQAKSCDNLQWNNTISNADTEDQPQIDSTDNLLSNYHEAMETFNSIINNTSSIWLPHHKQGDIYLYGIGDELEDTDAALREYNIAIKLGSPYSAYNIAVIYQIGLGVTIDHEKALYFSKEGAKRGDARCYCVMAYIYDINNNQSNSAKCWDRFFTSDDFINSTLLNESLFMLESHIYHYLEQCKSNKIELKFARFIVKYKSEILLFANKTIDFARNHNFEYMNHVLELRDWIDTTLSNADE